MKRVPRRPRTERLWAIVLCGKVHRSSGDIIRMFTTKRAAEEYLGRLRGATKSMAVRPILITPISGRWSLTDMAIHRNTVGSILVRMRQRRRKSKTKTTKSPACLTAAPAP